MKSYCLLKNAVILLSFLVLTPAPAAPSSPEPITIDTLIFSLPDNVFNMDWASVTQQEILDDLSETIGFPLASLNDAAGMSALQQALEEKNGVLIGNPVLVVNMGNSAGSMFLLLPQYFDQNAPAPPTDGTFDPATTPMVSLGFVPDYGNNQNTYSLNYNFEIVLPDIPDSTPSFTHKANDTITIDAEIWYIITLFVTKNIDSDTEHYVWVLSRLRLL
jgi:hypothetical protein